MSEKKLTRIDLYNLVWQQPLTEVAKQFDTTDYILRGVCKKYNIPLPKAGHWMKIKFGKPVAIDELDLSYDGLQEVALSDSSIEENNSLRATSELLQLQKEIENDPNLSLSVPEKLMTPDKLTSELKEALLERESYSSDHRLRAWDQLKVVVTKANIPRALQIIDTIIKGLKARGHDIVNKNGETCVVIFEEEIKVSLREQAKRVAVQGKYDTHSELQSTGILTFNIDGFYKKEWKDGKHKLEDQIASILAKLELEGKRLQLETEERHKYWAEQAKKKEAEEQIQRNKEKELQMFLSLQKSAKRFREAQMIREYIAAVEENAKSTGEIDEKQMSWIKWAREKADWYDPLVNSSDVDLCRS
jgi:hypothetical protein